jgi:hypothetical protein
VDGTANWGSSPQFGLAAGGSATYAQPVVYFQLVEFRLLLDQGGILVPLDAASCSAIYGSVDLYTSIQEFRLEHPAYGGTMEAGNMAAVKAVAAVTVAAATVYVTAVTSVTPTAAGVKATAALAERILTGERIGMGLKADAGHRAASFVTREQLEAGRVFIIKGGDGVERTLLQTEGVFNGRSGIYEYILDSSGNVTHQRFVESGTITGCPNS